MREKIVLLTVLATLSGVGICYAVPTEPTPTGSLTTTPVIIGQGMDAVFIPATDRVSSFDSRPVISSRSNAVNSAADVNEPATGSGGY